MARKRRMQAVKPISTLDLDYSEKYGATVEEAVALALSDLGLREDEVTIEVLEQPTKGFFGIGASPAHVRVEKKSEAQLRAEAKAVIAEMEEKEAKKRSEREEKNKAAEKSEGEKPAAEKKAASKAEPAENASEASLDDSYIEERLARAKEEAGGEEAYAAASPEEKPRREKRDRGERNKNRRDRRRKKGAQEAKEAPKETPEERDARIESFVENSEVCYASKRPDDLEPAPGCQAELFLKDIAEKMQLELNIKASKNEDHIYIDIDGKDCGTIIGKRGQTLDSIQYLTSLVVNKGEEEYIRVVVDAEGYRAKREKTLLLLAARLADKAAKSRKSVRLEPMNPYERKVIHACLQGDPRVKTRSEGEEPFRRVIIEAVK